MKKYLTLRVWILLFALAFALIAISPNPWASGIVVDSVNTNSDVAENGLSQGDLLSSINGIDIVSIEDVEEILAALEYPEQEVILETSEETLSYTITNDIGFELDENLTIEFSTEGLTEGSTLVSVNGVDFEDVESFEEFYESLVPYITISIQTDNGLVAYVTREVPDFAVAEQAKNNLKFGLDFTGGTRVLLEPVSEEGEITDEDITNLIDVLSNRLNVYGLSDVVIRSAADWEGNKFVLVEIAGVTEQEVKDLISQQGVFEGKVGEITVFEGGDQDIEYVCRNDGTCAGVRTCDGVEGAYSCQFQFTITLSQEAADRFAAATDPLEIIFDENGGGEYLSETIDFYLDGEQVDSLNIAADLKGSATTTIAISGPGVGVDQNAAIEDALANMNTLQTILITGSLPFDLEIAKIDTVSPILGESFLANVLLVGLLAILSVAVVLFIRYKVIKVVFPVMFAMLSELILILGFASAVGWNLDMAAIAGILAAVGTGVDDQIVILDETIKGDSQEGSWKDKLKRAFFIIMIAYATTVAAMIPLWNAGAGLIRGFALTTIVGVTMGVFLTRPAFAAIVEKMFK